MADETLLLRLIEFDTLEITCLLKAAFQLANIDGVIDVSEWNIVNLISALLETAKENAPEELKAKWHHKLAAVEKIVETRGGELSIDNWNLKSTFIARDKRETFLTLLFMVAEADKKILKDELDFILNHVALPLDFTRQELIQLLEHEKITEYKKIISLLESEI